VALRAHIRNDSLGDVTVHLEGDIDFDSIIPLRNEMVQLSDLNPHSKMTFDLNALDFVGSSGIAQFVEILQALKDRKGTFWIMNLKVEFTRVFKLYGLDISQMSLDQYDPTAPRRSMPINNDF
jgi:anti-sigma B factor antagonist